MPVISSVPGIAVGATVNIPEAVMPLPLTAKTYESARAVCVPVSAPANMSKAGRITFERDRVCTEDALADVRRASTDEDVPLLDTVIIVPSGRSCLAWGFGRKRNKHSPA